MKKLIVLLTALLLTSCDLFQSTDADVAAHNISKDADNFKINRRVVFYNGITDSYMLTIEGRLSIHYDSSDKQLEVTVKTGPGQFKKHYLGISDNVTYFVEQLDASETSVYHYKVIFKPQSIIPDIDFRGSKKELIKAVIPDDKD